MFRSGLLVAWLLLLAAISGTAEAGPTITDKRYWPNEVGPAAYRNSPVKDERRSPRLGMQSVKPAKSCTYQGGPKTGMWGCR
jgi:hypothetical protein